jgi:NAD(P)H-dependent FMN reductase
MKISVIAGSHCHDSESARVARYIEKSLRSGGTDQTYLLSLADNPLPLWDESVWGDDPRRTTICSPIAAELNRSDGFVIRFPYGM